MSLKISIFTDYPHLDKLMDELSGNDVLGAARASMNNAVRRTKTQGTKVFRKRVAIKVGPLNKRIKLFKARGGSLKTLVASLQFSGIPIGLINFIVGNDNVENQKGKPLSRRRKLKAKIRPGVTIRLKHAFIADIQSKQIFRRKGSTRRVRSVMSKSLAKMIIEKDMKKQLDNIFFKRFERQFSKQLQWRHSKTIKKFYRKPLKKL